MDTPIATELAVFTRDGTDFHQNLEPPDAPREQGRALVGDLIGKHPPDTLITFGQMDANGIVWTHMAIVGRARIEITGPDEEIAQSLETISALIEAGDQGVSIVAELVAQDYSIKARLYPPGIED